MFCLPELNRIVLEQKIDDRLLYLANTWLLNKPNMTQGIELFRPFVCDAMLAPVLHDILRSDWIEERKERSGTNNELKLGVLQLKVCHKEQDRFHVICPRFNMLAHGQQCAQSHDHSDNLGKDETVRLHPLVCSAMCRGLCCRSHMYRM